MMKSGAKTGADNEIAAFMRPYVKQFKKLEKGNREASEWNDRAVLRAQHMRLAGQTENAKSAQAASEYSSKALDKMSIMIMVAFHRQFTGWDFRSLGEMNAAISDEESGSGKAIRELGDALAKEKHKAAGYAKLPLAVLGLATLAVCAISRHFNTAGVIVLAAAGFGMAIANAVVNSIFSRREAALSTWEKAAARVHGLVVSGNGDDAMEAYIQEKALEEDNGSPGMVGFSEN